MDYRDVLAQHKARLQASYRETGVEASAPHSPGMASGGSATDDDGGTPSPAAPPHASAQGSMGETYPSPRQDTMSPDSVEPGEQLTPQPASIPQRTSTPGRAGPASAPAPTYEHQQRWQAATQSKIQAARAEAAAAEAAAVTGTPKLNPRSEALVAAARARVAMSVTPATTGGPSASVAPTSMDLTAFLAVAGGGDMPPPQAASERLYAEANARQVRAAERAAALQAEEAPGVPAITRKAAALGPSRAGQSIGDRLYSDAAQRSARNAAAVAAADRDASEPWTIASAAERRGSDAIPRGGLMSGGGGGNSAPLRSIYATSDMPSDLLPGGGRATQGQARGGPRRTTEAAGADLHARAMRQAEKREAAVAAEKAAARAAAVPKLNSRSMKLASARSDSAIERLYYAPLSKAQEAKEAADGAGSVSGAASVLSESTAGAPLREGELEACTFQPSISETSRRIAAKVHGGASVGDRLHQDSVARAQKAAARRARIEAETLAECTFEPATNKQGGEADEARGESPESEADAGKLKLTSASGSKSKRRVGAAQVNAMVVRMAAWQERKAARLEKLRAEKAAAEEDDCSFQPAPGKGRPRSPNPVPRARAPAPSSNVTTVTQAKGVQSFMARKMRARALAAEQSEAEQALTISRSRYAPDTAVEHAKRTGDGAEWLVPGTLDARSAQEAAAAAAAEEAYKAALRAEDEGRDGAGRMAPLVGAQTVLGAEAATVVSRLGGSAAASVASTLRGVSGGVSAATGASLPPLPDEVDERSRALQLTRQAVGGGGGVLPKNVSFHGASDYRASYATRHFNTVAVRDVLSEAQAARQARAAGSAASPPHQGGPAHPASEGGPSPPLRPVAQSHGDLDAADAVLAHAELALAAADSSGGRDLPASETPSSGASPANSATPPQDGAQPPPARRAPPPGVQQAVRAQTLADASAARMAGLGALGAGARVEVERREAAEARAAATARADAKARREAGLDSDGSDSDSSGERPVGPGSDTEATIAQLLEDASLYTRMLDERRARTHATAQADRLSPLRTKASGVVFEDEVGQTEHRPAPTQRRGGLRKPPAAPPATGASVLAEPSSVPPTPGPPPAAGKSMFASLRLLSATGGGSSQPIASSSPPKAAAAGPRGVDALKSRIDALVARSAAEAKR